MPEGDQIDDMLENYRRSSPDRRRVQNPDEIDVLKECPKVAVINISQDHWLSCVKGPDSEQRKGLNNTWTAISSSNLRLERGMVCIARKTIRDSDGNKTNKKHGVMGVWILEDVEEVVNNENHPWNDTYELYLYCESLETGQDVMYKESWNTLGIDSATMTGEDIFHLRQNQQKRYLREIIKHGDLKSETAEYLQSVIDCK